MQTYRATTRRHLSTSPFAAKVSDDLKSFDVGERVSHDREGLGRVHSVESDGAVIIDFGAGRLVRVVAPFAKLHTL
ncbi:hypothetical protein [Kribbella shirazensis]|uniref:Uncharacterized protein n=1 Tax=Kribbella shirazensis TaxID=1105143 RepID=A0A7X6A3F0_9ACTN|nr:hypothetical protein [Kribbella shirazensis]NIK59823.1 hypothetical protein [Kribbella shirazensis]